ncbi:MAG: CpaD family pilus assembly protein [Alphaproteobacteria bacterium]|nr:CpaD family pilus assembly protein [Alphaproteobacteria bacterium]
MRKVTRLLQASAPMSALVLIACAHPVAGPEDALSPEQRFAISVEPQMQTYRVPFESGAEPDPVIERELNGIGRDYLENGAGTIAVSAAPENAGAAERIAGELSGFGVPRNRIMVVPPGVADIPGTVAIGYVRYRAVSPACGDWSENLAVSHDNRPSSNLGCATEHNIAAEISDPRDLATPEPQGTEDAERRLTVLGKYQQGGNTGAMRSLGPAEQSGAVTAIGKGGGGM